MKVVAGIGQLITVVLLVAMGACASPPVTTETTESPSGASTRDQAAGPMSARTLAFELSRGVHGASSVEFSTLEEFIKGTDISVAGRLFRVEPGYSIPDDPLMDENAEFVPGATTSWMYVVIDPDRALAGDPALVTGRMRLDLPVPTNHSPESLDALLPTGGVPVVAVLFSAERFDSRAPDGYFGLPSSSMLVLGDGPDGVAYELGGEPFDEQLTLEGLSHRIQGIDER